MRQANVGMQQYVNAPDLAQTGSSEWPPYIMEKFKRQFGDFGLF